MEVLPSAQKLYRNGTVVASSSYTRPSISGAYSLLGKRHTGGGTPYYDGMDAEIILSTSLTDCDRQKLEGYLAHKWGLTANLPSNHPYLTSTSPTTGGTWTSSNPAVATINNAGVITGVSAGTATFTFTNTATGCTNTTNLVTVNTLPTVSLGKDTMLCQGEKITLNAGNANSYLWNDNSTVQTLQVTSAGVYKVTVTNSNNCTAADSINISYKNCKQLLIIEDTLKICKGDSVVIKAYGVTNET